MLAERSGDVIGELRCGSWTKIVMMLYEQAEHGDIDCATTRYSSMGYSMRDFALMLG